MLRPTSVLRASDAAAKLLAKRLRVAERKLNRQADRGTVTLYRALFRAHKRHLPADMRELGDRYVRDEWRLHRDAKPEFVPGFLDAWRKYLVEVEGSAVSGEVGADLGTDDLDAMTAEQLQQLEQLKDSAGGR